MISYVTALLCLASSIQAAVQINEFHYDNINADIDQFIEFRHTEPLTGYEVLLYNGYNGLFYNRTNLSNLPITTIAAKFNYTVVPFTQIANGMEGIALVTPNGTVVEFISYEGRFVAKNGPAKGMTSVDIKVSESSNCTSVGLSIQKCSDFNLWLSPKRATPGKLNRNCTSPNVTIAAPCGIVLSPIGAPTAPVSRPIATPVAVPVVVQPPTKPEVPVAVPVMEPTMTPVVAPVMEPTMAPVLAPVMKPVRPPAKPPLRPPTRPDTPPVAPPTKPEEKCGLFGLGIFCPFKCGFFKQLLNLC